MAVSPTGGVPIATAEWTDPRFSKSQEDALVRAAAADGSARLLGLDYAYRPVVSVRLGIPREARVYAIQRNGDPTEPKYKDGTTAGLLENWKRS